MARQRNFPWVSVGTRCLSRSDQKTGVSPAVSSPRSTSVPPQKFGRRLGTMMTPSTSLFHPSGSSGLWQPRPELTCASQTRRPSGLTSHLAPGTCRRGRSAPMLWGWNAAAPCLQRPRENRRASAPGQMRLEECMACQQLARRGLQSGSSQGHKVDCSNPPARRALWRSDHSCQV